MLFDKQEINTGRQMSVDMAKMLSIFFMVAIHTFEGDDGDVAEGIGYFFDSIAGAQFGAPVFMTCMGIGITYSRRNDAATMAKRGWKLFLAGYLLDVVRAIPFMLLWLQTKDQEYTSQIVEELFDVDILQFAGMAFLLLALLKKLKVNMWWTFVIAAIMLIAGGYLRGVDTGSFGLNFILSPIIGIHAQDGSIVSDFPLFNWLMFVVAGYGIGKVIRRCNNLDKLFGLTFPIAGLAYIAYSSYAIPNGIGMFGENELLFYHMGVRDFIVCLTAVVLIIGICHFVAKPLSEPIRSEIIRICSDLTRIYIAQWIIIKWVVQGLMEECFDISLTSWPLTGVAIIILILSILWARVKPLSQIKI